MSLTNPTTPTELLANERHRYADGREASEALHAELEELIPAGVGSTYRSFEPHPICAERAEGGELVSVDGEQFLDFALSNGSQLVGHANPAVTAAVEDQLGDGTLYTRPNRPLKAAAEAVIDRFPGVEKVRFTNSGTEAVMHATRLARAYTGNEKVIRMEGAYHGAHDESLVSKKPPTDAAGDPDDPTPVIESRGVPADTPDDLLLAQYNRPETVERLLREHDDVAAVLVEPACLNLGLVEPENAFLEQLRELTREHDTLLVFDEVKTGAKLAPGGGAEYYGVTPDLAAYAKAIGGGFPVGAFGGRADVMATIAADLEEGVATGAAHYGTYNGNLLVGRAVEATLSEVLTPDVYERLGSLSEELAAGYEERLAEHGLDGYTVTAGTQGMVYLTDEHVRTFRDWETVDETLHEAYWLGMVNEGVIPHPHDASQQWTVGVPHTSEDVATHLAAFDAVAKRLTAVQQ